MNNKLWHDIFQSLKSFQSLLMEFSMRNGSQFLMILPPQDKIEVDTFSEEFQFPFKFEEIRSVKILFRFNDKIYLTNEQIMELKKIIAQNTLIKTEGGDQSLILSPP